MEWIYFLYLLNTVFILFIAIWEVRRPSKALNWIVIALVLPVIGFLLYLSISNPKLIHRKRLTSSHNESDKLPDTYSDSASIIADALRYFTVGGLGFESAKSKLGSKSTSTIKECYMRN